jgi:hypothetical protein
MNQGLAKLVSPFLLQRTEFIAADKAGAANARTVAMIAWVWWSHI